MWEDPEPVNGGAFFSRKRIKILILGSIGALVLGAAIVLVFTYIQYGGTPLDRIFHRTKPNPLNGKLAYEKDSDRFIGVIRSEGFSTRRGVDVYYIERPGGQLIEFPKSLVTVRQPDKK